MTKKELTSLLLAAGLKRTNALRLASELPLLRTYADERLQRANAWRSRLKVLRGGTTARDNRRVSLKKKSLKVRRLGEQIQRVCERARLTLGLERLPANVSGALDANRDSAMTCAKFLLAMANVVTVDRYPFRQGEDLGKLFLIDELRFFFKEHGLDDSPKVGRVFYKVVSVATGKPTPNQHTLKQFHWTDAETEKRRAKKAPN